MTFAFSPRGKCEGMVVSLIDGETQALDIADYAFTNEAIFQAISRAHQRNVNVRVVFDRSETKSYQAKYYDKIEALGVPIKLSTSPFGGIMHNKFVVAYAQGMVENGSFNYTESAQLRNYENVQINSGADLILAYQQAFEGIWTGAKAEVGHPLLRRLARFTRRFSVARF